MPSHALCCHSFCRVQMYFIAELHRLWFQNNGLCKSAVLDSVLWLCLLGCLVIGQGCALSNYVCNSMHKMWHQDHISGLCWWCSSVGFTRPPACTGVVCAWVWGHGTPLEKGVWVSGRNVIVANMSFLPRVSSITLRNRVGSPDLGTQLEDGGCGCVKGCLGYLA